MIIGEAKSGIIIQVIGKIFTDIGEQIPDDKRLYYSQRGINSIITIYHEIRRKIKYESRKTNSKNI